MVEEDEVARQEVVAVFAKHDHDGAGRISKSALARVLAEVGCGRLSHAEADALVHASQEFLKNGGDSNGSINYAEFIDFVFSSAPAAVATIGVHVVHRDMALEITTTTILNVCDKMLQDTLYVKELTKRPTNRLDDTGMSWSAQAGQIVKDSTPVEDDSGEPEELSESPKAQAGTPAQQNRKSVLDLGTDGDPPAAAQTNTEQSGSFAKAIQRPSLQEEVLERQLLGEARRSFKSPDEARKSYTDKKEHQAAARRESVKKVPEAVVEQLAQDAQEAAARAAV